MSLFLSGPGSYSGIHVAFHCYISLGSLALIASHSQAATEPCGRALPYKHHVLTILDLPHGLGVNHRLIGLVRQPGAKSSVDYSPWGCKESDTTEVTEQQQQL